MEQGCNLVPSQGLVTAPHWNRYLHPPSSLRVPHLQNGLYDTRNTRSTPSSAAMQGMYSANGCSTNLQTEEFSLWGCSRPPKWHARAQTTGGGQWLRAYVRDPSAATCWDNDYMSPVPWRQAVLDADGRSARSAIESVRRGHRRRLRSSICWGRLRVAVLLFVIPSRTSQYVALRRGEVRAGARAN